MSAAVPSTSQAEDRLEFWIKAFIPNIHPTNPELTVPVPGQPNEWMLKGPPPNKDCFETDDRSFSSDRFAKAKITTRFSLIASDNAARIEPTDGAGVHTPGLSSKIDCRTGKTVDQRPGVFGVRAIGSPSFADGKSQIIGQASIKNPFTPVGSPYIDYSFDYIFDSADGTLKYALTIGAFPAFEAYVSINGSAPQTILQRPPTGNSPFSLYDMGTGFNIERLAGSIKLREPIAPNLNGKWSGECIWSDTSVKDPVTLTFSGSQYSYSIEHVSQMNGSKDSASLSIDKNSRHASYKLFGTQYEGTFDAAYKVFTAQASALHVICTYRR